jgi:enoyl-CoA hydratase/carnithine racemase
MTFECIKYEVKDGIGWITFNRPEVRNALSRQTLDGVNAGIAGYV